MEKIAVSARGTSGGALLFSVRVGGGSGASEYLVTVPQEFWSRFEDRFRDQTDLVEKSFRFLLSRETKEEIVRHFALSDISKYFRDYETEVVKIR